MNRLCGQAICWRWLRRIHNAVDRTLAPSSAAADDLRAHGIEQLAELGSAGRGPGTGVKQELPGLVEYDVVGPICESSDYLARGRRLPPLEPCDLVCIFTSGAYCMTRASQYNSTPRPPEVMVRGSGHQLIRRRETYEDLFNAELGLT